jgi:hypothetical protein
MSNRIGPVLLDDLLEAARCATGRRVQWMRPPSMGQNQQSCPIDVVLEYTPQPIERSQRARRAIDREVGARTVDRCFQADAYGQGQQSLG